MRSPFVLGFILAFAAVACAKHHVPPGPARDASVDATVDASEGPIDCSTVGCGLAPICGELCEDPCGCCACDGEVERDGVTYVCTFFDCYVADVVPVPRCSTSSECPEGWACCDPCGIPGCETSCTPACNPADPACVDGCLLVP